jgi:hypothetical protein
MKSKFTIAWFALLALALPNQSRAQGGVPLWTNRYSGPGKNSTNGAVALAVDGSGNIFVTGNSTDSSSDSHYTTIKYSGAGVPLWTNRYNGPGGYDRASGVAVDGSGNAFVTGTSSVGVGNDDYATIKYSNAGVPLWTNRYDGPTSSEDDAYAVAVDGSGNVIVTGRSVGSGSYYDYATIKYSGAGVPLWTNRYNGPGNGYDQAAALAVDGIGNVFVTGQSLVGADYATIKYSSAGVPLWTNRYHGPGGSAATALAVDSSGNVFVTGYSIASGSGYDYATIKYSNAGVPLWTNLYNGPGNRSDIAHAIAVGGSGNVFVTGLADSSFAYATIAYSGEGVPLWTNRYSGSEYSSAVGIAVDQSGNVFVTGFSTGSGSNFGYYEFATIAYSGEGVPLWTNRYNGLGNGLGDSSAFAVALDGSGNVFVTGSSYNGRSYDYATIKYSAIPPPVHLGFQRLNNQLILSWTNAGFSLQTAPDLSATFTNLPGASSPYTNPATAPQQFFRLKLN